MDFIDDFIQEYKNNPCLWKANSADFKNRAKRQEAYMKLIEVAAKHGEHYNVERTKQKINNLRCAFRHQLKKYNECRNKGEKEEPYCPKRKYFESLLFLKDEEILDKRFKNDEIHYVEKSKVNLVTEVEHLSEIVDGREQLKSLSIPSQVAEIEYKGKDIINDSNEVESSVESEEQNCYISKIIEQPLIQKETSESQTSLGNSYEHKKRTGVRKRSYSISSQASNDLESVNSKNIKADISSFDLEKIFSLACNSLRSSIDDHFADFGKVIAHKLRTMENSQAIYAEKIIGDVLFQGQMKMLSSSSINQLFHFEKN